MMVFIGMSCPRRFKGLVEEGVFQMGLQNAAFFVGADEVERVKTSNNAGLCTTIPRIAFIDLR